jgi:ubiquinone biosynthesis protein UbiJ
MSSFADIALERLLERAVATARRDSPRAVALLHALSGRKLSLQILGTPFTLLLQSNGETLRVSSATPGDTTSGDTILGEAILGEATMAAAPLSLLALAGVDPQAVIARGDVRIDGDAEVAQQFRELGMLLRPDLEAGLSRLLGRGGAHMAMLGVRSARDWTRSSAATAVQNVAEYLAHERGDLVSRAEAEHFLKGVDQAREQLDRLEARVRQLEPRSPKS